VRRASALALVALALPLSGCETSAEKSAQLARIAARRVIEVQTGLVITRPNRFAHVVRATVVSDSSGAAVAVTVRNDSGSTLQDVPIAVTVRAAGGRVVYQNNTPGLEPSLVSIGLLGPHAQLTWVDDQVTAAGAASASAQLGQAPTTASPVASPMASGAKLSDDPVNGPQVTGTLSNPEADALQTVTVYAIVVRGGVVVAAGRAIVPALPGRGSAPFDVFLVGKPTGGKLALSAVPTEQQAP